ncbi:hypothetical protein [Sporomusa sphaeroides]|uniref:hypothetical protein n=1 Tax=Sporomusa sphaeroides TaxID=47679 RepID=UPI0031585B8E
MEKGKMKIIIGLLVVIAIGIGIIVFQQVAKSREETQIKQKEEQMIKEIEENIQKTLNQPRTPITEGKGKFR